MERISKWKWVLFTVFAWTACTAGISDAYAQSGWGRATFFQLPNYQGRSFVVYGTGSLSNLSKKRRGRSGNWNDKISSVYIEGDFMVTLFQDKNFNGPSVVLDHSTADLRKISGSMDWSNRATSLYYEPNQPLYGDGEVIFYDNPSYSGNSFVLAAGDEISDLFYKRRDSVWRNWDDEIESLTIRGNIYVELFEYADYSGRSVVLSGSEPDLFYLGWKKRTSSVLVIPITPWN
jgi:hypothetical protein